MEIEESIALFAASIKKKKITEKVYLKAALQRIAASDIFAPLSVPDFPKSAMDGYAVCAKDTLDASRDNPKVLKVIGNLYAGDSQFFEYQPNCCIRIMTGAPIPDGYDSVVKQEDTNYGTDECIIYKGVEAYDNYCSVGEDVQKGELLIPAGTVLQPLHLGVLASCGITEVEVLAPLKVGILNTGSELIALDEQLSYGKIYNNIGYILQGSLQKQGIEVVAYEQCDDVVDKLKQSLLKMIEEADFVITTGGISVGEKDLLPAVLKVLGGNLVFGKANIQPGTPTQGWIIKNKPVLCLSGNPYAAYANFELYFWEAAAKALNCEALKVKAGTAVLKNAIRKVVNNRRLLRGFVDNGCVMVPDVKHSASVVSDMLNCNCFVEVNKQQDLSAGKLVNIRLFK